jgi:hypothetical protein
MMSEYFRAYNLAELRGHSFLDGVKQKIYLNQKPGPSYARPKTSQGHHH